ncbi:MAG: sulfatase [Verrucomicrobiales bacterium]|nr:sulfatase [Verrucomicrobiales bacterium]|tara:strand:- start:11907 stop:13367 length:1461 start_codon:yes stop_codon:yes gene_type:complete
MQPFNPLLETRRQFLLRTGNGIGAAALSTMLNPSLIGSAMGEGMQPYGGLPNIPHFPGKAKRVIYMFMAGGPSHIDLFDYKPIQRKLHGTELPDSVRQDQRLTGMSSGQKSFPCVAPMFEFGQYGEHQTWVNKDLLPHTAGVVDKITIMKSLHTEAVNHDPAITFINTGAQQQGKPSMGAWLSYGMGSVNENMPGYVVMISRGRGQLQALYDRLWGSGFLPAKHQGVKLRSAGEPVLYLKNPKGFDREARRGQLDSLEQLNELNYDKFADPEIQARISQYELAFRMQSEVPGLMDIEGEPDHVKELYGPQTDKPGSFARNCLLARRMAEKGVRYIQLFHRGWDQHGALPSKIRQQCEDIDQPAAALLKDLDQRGMLEDTLVVFGGEFGRTIYSQGKLTKDNHGRDHHGRCFSMWMAGAGVKRGFEYGKTDDHSYNIIENPVHIRDMNATILHQLGIDHNKLTFKYQGLDQRLTGVEEAHVVKDILS